MGTVNILECVRESNSVTSFLNITTDKVYLNREWEWGYREDEALDGYDPYSNSKSCSEIITHSYYNSFLKDKGVAVSTARAGNVIGGGDFSADRIITDCVKAIKGQDKLTMRNPGSVRPYQHVLEPLAAYLIIAEAQFKNKEHNGWYNVGPDEGDCITTGRLAEMFYKSWGESLNADYEKGIVHEAKFLKLDCGRLKTKFGWKPVWNIDIAVNKTVEWYKAYLLGKDIKRIIAGQINEYLETFNAKN